MEQMNYLLALPEIALALFACVFLLADSVTKGRILPMLHHVVVLSAWLWGPVAWCWLAAPRLKSLLVGTMSAMPWGLA
ncbi:MAG: hypothetical protein HC848_02985 [Limnobacter sp.]|nr:hypothetical protein [Limnobacter sp.]